MIMFASLSVLALSQFQNEMFHVEDEGGTKSAFLKTRDLVTFDGDVDEMKGGSVSLHSLNSSFTDTKAAFSEYYKTNEGSPEWFSNVTVSFVANGANKDFFGRAIFLTEASQPKRCLEIVMYSDASHTSLQAIFLTGPNPQPRPPGPGPPGGSACNEVYTKDACAKVKTCQWCESTDKHHQLCFPTANTKKLDTKKWSCDSSTRSTHAFENAIETSRRLQSNSSATCSGRTYSGETMDTTTAYSTSKAKTGADCCVACQGDAKCHFWSYNPDSPTHGKFCHFYATTTRPVIFPASSKTMSGEKSSAPGPGPHPPMPTPKPAKPTPPPTPVPAPSPPTPAPKGVKNWAVIVAGSKSFGNYRHQADACHAYQIVRKNGVPPENIIMMMQDDVANAKENPFPGQLFNKPTKAGEDGVDVYDGCAPDYTGNGVNAQLFLDVLTGNTAGNATKVLKSGPDDFVFVNFADHGGGKIIAMPNGPYLKAEDLVDTLKTMHTKKMYAKLVFYMEACNSGSMFEDLLPTDLNIYATTAANPSEPSWGTYCPPLDMINGKAVGSCLGDLYSVNWMEDSDTKTGFGSRLGDQFIKVKAETNKSHTMEYGTQDWKWNDLVSDFQSDDLDNNKNKNKATTTATATASPAVPKDAVDSRDIDLVLAFYKYLRSPSSSRADRAERSAAADALLAQIQHREASDVAFGKIFTAVRAAPMLYREAPITSEEQVQCERTVVDAAEQHCGVFSSYSLKFTAPLVELCKTRPAEQVLTALRDVCV